MRRWLAGSGWVIACGLAAFVATRGANHPASLPSGVMLEPLPAAQSLRLTIHLDEAPLEKLAEALSLQLMEEVELDAPLLATMSLSPQTPVTLHCDRATPQSALEQVTSAGKPLALATYFDAGEEVTRFALAPLEVARARDVQLRVYDLQPVLLAFAKRSARASTVLNATASKESMGTLLDLDDVSRITPMIITLLQEVISPADWRENGGRVGSARVMGTLLNVTHRGEAHVRIRQLLDDLAAEHFDQIGTAGGLR